MQALLYLTLMVFMRKLMCLPHQVEALESGVFRADLPVRFKCVPSAYQGLLENLDRDLGYAITVEHKASLDDIENYEEVKVGAWVLPAVHWRTLGRAFVAL